jgi:hypothetical protein
MTNRLRNQKKIWESNFLMGLNMKNSEYGAYIKHEHLWSNIKTFTFDILHFVVKSFNLNTVFIKYSNVTLFKTYFLNFIWPCRLGRYAPNTCLGYCHLESHSPVKRQGTIGFPSVSARPLSITIVWRQWFRRCFYGRRKLEFVTWLVLSFVRFSRGSPLF